MTQSHATNQPAKRPNGTSGPVPRPSPGTTVQYEDRDEIGVVVESDDFYDTLQLRGVPLSGQVLIEWPRGGFPVRQWTLVAHLHKTPEAAQ